MPFGAPWRRGGRAAPTVIPLLYLFRCTSAPPGPPDRWASGRPAPPRLRRPRPCYRALPSLVSPVAGGLEASVPARRASPHAGLFEGVGTGSSRLRRSLITDVDRQGLSGVPLSPPAPSRGGASWGGARGVRGSKGERGRVSAGEGGVSPFSFVFFRAGGPFPDSSSSSSSRASS